MKNRYDFFDDIWNDDIQHHQKFLLDHEFKKKLNEYDYILYNITLADEYRPDLIAHKFYGNSKLYWILVYANDINDSPQGFKTNTQIKIPNPSIIGTLV